MKPITFAISEREAQTETFGDSVCISISDNIYSDETKALYTDRYKETLFLRFLDLDWENLLSMTDGQRERYQDRLFTAEIANQIIDFALSHKDQSIVVHCAAGISRSQAVALFIAKYIYQDIPQFNKLYHDDNKVEGGNILVYRTLERKHYSRFRMKTDSDFDLMF